MTSISMCLVSSDLPLTIGLKHTIDFSNSVVFGYMFIVTKILVSILVKYDTKQFILLEVLMLKNAQESLYWLLEIFCRHDFSLWYIFP